MPLIIRITDKEVETAGISPDELGTPTTAA